MKSPSVASARRVLLWLAFLLPPVVLAITDPFEGPMVDYALAFLLGAFVGVGELISRYRDEPWTAMATLPAALYVYVNGTGSLAALAAVRTFDWTFGVTGGATRWTQVLTAGLGAMALFRTSLFVIRAGDTDVGVGPSGLMDNFLKSADAGVDRRRAVARAKSVTKALEGIRFVDACDALPRYCFALMQNMSDADENRITRTQEELRKSEMDDTLKVLALGLALMDVVGLEVLVAAAASLKNRILARGVQGDVYKRLGEAVDASQDKERVLDVIGLTLYTAWPEIEGWLESDRLAGWTVRLRCLAPDFIRAQGAAWIDAEWADEAARLSSAVAAYRNDRKDALRDQSTTLDIALYSVMPALHGFKVGNGAYFIAFTTWDVAMEKLKRPLGFYEHLPPGDQSLRAREYRTLFDNWLERLDHAARPAA